eukprot:COSAG02_NODE_13988_length_1323_cov_10.659314_2_plen_160_part_00
MVPYLYFSSIEEEFPQLRKAVVHPAGRPSVSAMAMVSWVPLLLLVFLAAAGSAAASRAPVPAPSGYGGIAVDCLQQLAKDGCDPSAGPQRCGQCAQRHRGDLLAANCTEAYLLHWFRSWTLSGFALEFYTVLAAAQGGRSPEQVCHSVLRAQGTTNARS